MFEKEAEEYVMREDVITENDKVPFDNGYGFQTVSFEDEVKKGFQDGAEFGYNKALKETWHYTSKGDFPKTEGSYYVAMDNGRGYKSGAILNWVEETDYEEGFHWEDDDYECYDEQVYAWKECPTLPPKLFISCTWGIQFFDTRV